MLRIQAVRTTSTQARYTHAISTQTTGEAVSGLKYIDSNWGKTHIQISLRPQGEMKVGSVAIDLCGIEARQEVRVNYPNTINVLQVTIRFSSISPLMIYPTHIALVQFLSTELFRT
ncbi:hypothetical protein AVEN_242221-1 [Araneus ventricosus]|uniref:Uncharacterized protein n=1 Tax=Araneus ventricosus TaxID=182803 RepID=A0A4Y2FWR7_ARAVE|nr:hypothetical protein AVEN_242221-1 [Araneus ventricosus]